MVPVYSDVCEFHAAVYGGEEQLRDNAFIAEILSNGINNIERKEPQNKLFGQESLRSAVPPKRIQ